MLVENQAPKNFRFEACAAENFYAENDSFDVVLSHNWLHHSPDPIKSLYKIIKPLKIGGTFYLCTYQARTFRALVCEFARRYSVKFVPEKFLQLVSFFFPGGFAQFNFYQIIHYENLIDDYLVPFVRFGHLDHLEPAMKRGGLSLRAEGVSCLLRKPALFDVEEIPLKVTFTKTGHFEELDEFRIAVGNGLFSESSPWLPADFSDLSDKVDIAFEIVKRDQPIDGPMNLVMAMHALRCQFATSSGNVKVRFECFNRMLDAVISGDNKAYSLHSPDNWGTKRHPLWDEIIRTTPGSENHHG